jgi:iron complex transport system substrate-binding protein
MFPTFKHLAFCTIFLLPALSLQDIHAEKFTYNRIISLSPLLTEEIFLLERDDSLIADTTYCTHPEAAARKEKIGNLIDFSVEKICRMKPDLILASGMTDPRKLGKFRELKIPCETFLQPVDFKDICGQYIRLGKLLDREQKAVKTVRDVQSQVELLRKKNMLLQKKRVFIEIGTHPLFTVSRDSFINDFIVMANGENIAENSGPGMISLETVLKNDPEVIIISDMGIDTGSEMKIWRKYGSLTAVRNKAIFVIDSYGLCSPTPVSFVTTLEKIIRMIRPEEKQ